MVLKGKKGFSAIQAIVVMAIIGIIAVPSAYLMAFLVKNGVFIPNKLNMEMLVSDAMDIMVNGDEQSKGLRTSRSVTSMTNYQVVFVDQNNVPVRYTLRTDLTPTRLVRSINGGAEANLPYYVPFGVTVEGKSGLVFAYYDANEAVTAIPTNVRRIEITLVARTGTGSYTNWEGQSEQKTAIAVKKFQ